MIYELDEATIEEDLKYICKVQLIMSAKLLQGSPQDIKVVAFDQVTIKMGFKPGFHSCLKGAWDMSKVPVTHVSTCVLSQAQ